MCALHANGSARRGAAHTDGVALTAARRRKEATNPELVGRRGRARLVVLVEVGGKWSPETQSFLSQLASAKARADADAWNKRGDFGGAPVVMFSRGLEVRMALVRPLMRWNALVCSLVWLTESGRFGGFLCLRSLLSSVS